MNRTILFSAVLFSLFFISVALAASYNLYIGVYKYGTTEKLMANITVFNSTSNWNCNNCNSYPWTLSLAPGTYTIDTESSGYQTDTRAITIYNRDKAVNIYLKPSQPVDNPPQWSNQGVTPQNPVYSPNQDYTFEITWTDDFGISQVLIELDNVNYTVTGTDVYSKIFSDLSAGTHPYRWFARDTANQWNSTSVLDYIITQATPQLTLTAIPSWSVAPNTDTIVECSADINQVILHLFRNGQEVGNPDAATLNEGTYQYVCVAPETQNYSFNSISNNLVVGQGPQPLPDLAVSSSDFAFTPSNLVEGDDVTVDVDIHNIGTVDSGFFEYYLIDLTTGVVDSGTIANVPASSFVTVSATFQNLISGTHVFRIFADSTNIVIETNETNNFPTASLVVSSPTDTTPPLCSNFQTNPSSPTAYSSGALYSFQATCIDNVDIGSVYLEFGGVNYTATRNVDVYSVELNDLSAGNYPNRWIATDVNNLQSEFVRPIYEITRVPTTLRLFLNGTEGNRNYVLGEYANFTALLENLPGKNVVVSTDIPTFITQIGPSPLEVLYQLNDRGVFVVTGSFVGDQNYSASSQTYFINVDGTDVIPPVVTGPTFSKNPAFVNENVEIRCNATDETGLQSVILARRDSFGNWANDTMGLEGGDTYLLTYSQNMPETIEVFCTAYDTSNNYGESGPGILVFIQDTTLPVVQIIDPQNTTYTPATFPNGFYWTPSEPFLWAAYSLDGQPNVTITGNVTPPPSEALTLGSHNLIIYATDPAGNIGFDQVYYTIEALDTTPPLVNILSPENLTYDVNTIDLIFTVNELTSWSGYSLDGQANITSGNTTLTDLQSGMHDLIVYATDLTGNTGSDEVSFTVACLSHLVNSNIDGVFYLDILANIFGQSTVTCSFVNTTNVTTSEIDISNVTLSNINNSTITNADVYNCSISDSTFGDQSCKDTNIDPSDVQRSNTTGSTITDSHVWDSNATYSSINLSWLDFCDITNSTLFNVTCSNSTIYLSNVSNSTVSNSVIRNSTVENSDIRDMIVENATIRDNVLEEGCIIYQGVEHCAVKNLNDIYNPTTSQPPSTGSSNFYGFSDFLVIDSPATVEMMLGVEKSFTITVSNQGPSFSNVFVEVQGIPGQWFVVTPNSQSIDSKQAKTYTITINIPLTEAPGKKTVTLLARGEAESRKTITLDIKENIILPGGLAGAFIAVSNPAVAAGIIIIIVSIVLIYLYYFKRERWDSLVSYLRHVYSEITYKFNQLIGRNVIEIEEYKKNDTKQTEIEVSEHPDAEDVAKFTVEYEE